MRGEILSSVELILPQTVVETCYNIERYVEARFQAVNSEDKTKSEITVEKRSDDSVRIYVVVVSLKCLNEKELCEEIPYDIPEKENAVKSVTRGRQGLRQKVKPGLAKKLKKSSGKKRPLKLQANAEVLKSIEPETLPEKCLDNSKLTSGDYASGNVSVEQDNVYKKVPDVGLSNKIEPRTQFKARRGRGGRGGSLRGRRNSGRCTNKVEQLKETKNTVHSSETVPRKDANDTIKVTGKLKSENLIEPKKDSIIDGLDAVKSPKLKSTIRKRTRKNIDESQHKDLQAEKPSIGDNQQKGNLLKDRKSPVKSDEVSSTTTCKAKGKKSKAASKSDTSSIKILREVCVSADSNAESNKTNKNLISSTTNNAIVPDLSVKDSATSITDVDNYITKQQPKTNKNKKSNRVISKTVSTHQEQQKTNQHDNVSVPSKIGEDVSAQDLGQSYKNIKLSDQTSSKNEQHYLPADNGSVDQSCHDRTHWNNGSSITPFPIQHCAPQMAPYQSESTPPSSSQTIPDQIRHLSFQDHNSAISSSTLEDPSNQAAPRRVKTKAQLKQKPSELAIYSDNEVDIPVHKRFKDADSTDTEQQSCLQKHAGKKPIQKPKTLARIWRTRKKSGFTRRKKSKPKFGKDSGTGLSDRDTDVDHQDKIFSLSPNRDNDGISPTTLSDQHKDDHADELSREFPMKSDTLLSKEPNNETNFTEIVERQIDEKHRLPKKKRHMVKLATERKAAIEKINNATSESSMTLSYPQIESKSDSYPAKSINQSTDWQQTPQIHRSTDPKNGNWTGPETNSESNQNIASEDSSQRKGWTGPKNINRTSPKVTSGTGPEVSTVTELQSSIIGELQCNNGHNASFPNDVNASTNKHAGLLNINGSDAIIKNRSDPKCNTTNCFINTPENEAFKDSNGETNNVTKDDVRDLSLNLYSTCTDFNETSAIESLIQLSTASDASFSGSHQVTWNPPVNGVQSTNYTDSGVLKQSNPQEINQKETDTATKSIVEGEEEPVVVQQLMKIATGSKAEIADTSDDGARQVKRAYKREFIVQCQFCQVKVKDYGYLFRHVKKLHHDKGLEMKKHLEEIRPLMRTPCPICEKMVSSISNISSHIKQCHATKESAVLCPICNKTYKTTVSLRQHLRQCHQPQQHRFFCHLCSANFTEKRSLKEHINCSHETTQVFHCDDCGKSFLTKGRLRRHKYIHGDFRHRCSYCNKGFHLKDNMNKHIEIVHEKTQGKRFKCTHCDKKFTVKGNMTQHVMGVHLKQFQYTCPQCQAGFRRKKDMLSHMLKHGESPANAAMIGQLQEEEDEDDHTEEDEEDDSTDAEEQLNHGHSMDSPWTGRGERTEIITGLTEHAEGVSTGKPRVIIISPVPSYTDS